MFTSNTKKPPHHRLRITAGPHYDPQTHHQVTVNGPDPLRIESSHLTADLWVRIKDYTGYPASSPATNPYFTANDNRYSLTFSLTFTHPVNGNDLLFGNDFDHPIRDYLPPGFGTAFRIVQTMLDPSLEGDAHAEKPYLYSPALASWNQLRVGDTTTPHSSEARSDLVVMEGADGSGEEVRRRYGMPEDAAARTKFFRAEEKRAEFEFEPGRVYQADFGNPYLDFNGFAIHIPGITLNISKYVSEKNNVLRYVLKNRTTGEEYLVVNFTVVLEEAQAEAGDGNEGVDEVD
ncbi:DUF1769 domain-containing protein [Aspergillus saccharolyticus JOP 1030-1]|uniref:DUF1769-domain-containing protein n=1 Tax=Aspergillus saccharolyticus JOP 1030-1 TaxID=1450539 RepID=A0A318ZP88_9EURO|nr:DUF1769-domain-containing protein [Aspergillus saccharolyticus JOP 1030-1]PYH49356.1 DUF1769-domain-containing protein [Aspergillus saccharolyticus JOP 1030-1]